MCEVLSGLNSINVKRVCYTSRDVARKEIVYDVVVKCKNNATIKYFDKIIESGS